MKKFLIPASLIFTLACGGGEKNRIEIDGSSTVYPITEAIAEDFRSSNKNIDITIGVSGTGGGFKKFIRNEIGIANASRPITASEDQALKEAGIEYIELPVAYDGLAVVVHPDNKFVDYFTVNELKKLWEPAAQGQIKKWNQIRATWPDEEIHLFGAGTQSGTFDYFTEAIVGKSKASRGDYTASEDDNVLVQGISSDPKALGYFGLDYYEENKTLLKLVPIDDEIDENGKGPIYPTAITVKDASYQPLARPLLVYINKKALEKPEVEKFMKYYLQNAYTLVPETGYISLNKEIYNKVMEKLDKRVTGSAFLSRSSSVGIKLEDLVSVEEK